MFSWGFFETATAKTFENIQKTYLVECDKIARLRSTSTPYYRTKNPITDNFLEGLRKEKLP